VLLAGILTLTICACQPQAARSASSPTLQIIRVQYTPSMQPHLAALHDCAAALPSAGIVVTEKPASALDVTAADLSLRFGLPVSFTGKAYPLGDEQLVAVSAPSGSLSRLSPTEILSAYNGVPPDTLTRITLWTLPEGDDLRQQLETGGIKASAPASPTFVAPGPLELRESVAADGQAIGILTQDWADASVHATPLGISVPALALTSAEPAGPLRQLIACLQNKGE
jgi:hypothetical protein